MVNSKPRCGIALDDTLGHHSGTTKGSTYFRCRKKHGVLVAPKKVARLEPAVMEDSSSSEDEEVEAGPEETSDSSTAKAEQGTSSGVEKAAQNADVSTAELDSGDHDASGTVRVEGEVKPGSTAAAGNEAAKEGHQLQKSEPELVARPRLKSIRISIPAPPTAPRPMTNTPDTKGKGRVHDFDSDDGSDRSLAASPDGDRLVGNGRLHSDFSSDPYSDTDAGAASDGRPNTTGGISRADLARTATKIPEGFAVGPDTPVGNDNFGVSRRPHGTQPVGKRSFAQRFSTMIRSPFRSKRSNGKRPASESALGDEEEVWTAVRGRAGTAPASGTLAGGNGGGGGEAAEEEDATFADISGMLSDIGGNESEADGAGPAEGGDEGDEPEIMRIKPLPAYRLDDETAEIRKLSVALDLNPHDLAGFAPGARGAKGPMPAYLLPGSPESGGGGGSSSSSGTSKEAPIPKMHRSVFLPDSDLLPGCDAAWYSQRIGFNPKLSKEDKAGRAQLRGWFSRALQLCPPIEGPAAGMFMAVRHELLPNGKPSKHKAEKVHYVVQYGAVLLFYDQPSDTQLVGPEALVVVPGSAVIAQSGAKSGLAALRIQTRNAGAFTLSPLASSAVANPAPEVLEETKRRFNLVLPVKLPMSHYSGIETEESFQRITALQDASPSTKQHEFVNLVMLGPTGSGKTSMLSLLRHGAMDTLVSQVERHTVALSWSSTIALQITEVRGGHTNAWAAHCLPKKTRPAPYGIIFVVDSTDKVALPLARRQLQQLLKCEQLKDTIFIVVANKHGYHEKEAMPSVDIEKALDINTPRQQTVVYCTASCMNKAGLSDVLSAVHASLPDPTIK